MGGGIYDTLTVTTSLFSRPRAQLDTAPHSTKVHRVGKVRGCIVSERRHNLAHSDTIGDERLEPHTALE